jgi:hypothetical protein
MKSWITGDIFTYHPERKTLKAWEPWEFTLHTLFFLQNADIGEDFPEWKMEWFAGVAALRTIGHVLHKVDSEQSQNHQNVINQTWKSWNFNKDDNWIFFDFIEKERNNILKEFSFGAELPSLEDGRVLAYGNTDYDASQLFREAVYWWRHELEKIEKALLISSSEDLKKDIS